MILTRSVSQRGVFGDTKEQRYQGKTIIHRNYSRGKRITFANH